jgi:hypothetical protein
LSCLFFDFNQFPSIFPINIPKEKRKAQKEKRKLYSLAGREGLSRFLRKILPDGRRAGDFL